MKKIAIIGSGISGVSATYYLNKLGYDVSLFEAGNYFGGHTNTIDIELEGKILPIDTGFLVHNDRTYPNLIHFFNELNINTHQSEMSFSVDKESDQLVWAGTNLFTVFAQVKNLFSLKFYKFLREVLRFNKNSDNYLIMTKDKLNLTLGAMLDDLGYSKEFRDWYLLPMGGCIWSTPTKEMLEFPAYTFLIFCKNHGLLQIFNRPVWKTVSNGCRTYVEKSLTKIEKKFINEPVLEVSKSDKLVLVKTKNRKELFDYCIMCTHPPETLKIFQSIDNETKALLSNFKYQKNSAVLHLDESILPKNKKAWASWNYSSVKTSETGDGISVSYLINKLQPLPTNKTVIVTLNPVSPIDENKIIKKIDYEHPVFSTESILAQSKMNSVQGRENVYFSGAWMRYGFHEDGILSTKIIINKLLADDGRSDELLDIL